MTDNFPRKSSSESMVPHVPYTPPTGDPVFSCCIIYFRRLLPCPGSVFFPPPPQGNPPRPTHTLSLLPVTQQPVGGGSVDGVDHAAGIYCRRRRRALNARALPRVAPIFHQNGSTMEVLRTKLFSEIPDFCQVQPVPFSRKSIAPLFRSKRASTIVELAGVSQRSR